MRALLGTVPLIALSCLRVYALPTSMRAHYVIYGAGQGQIPPISEMWIIPGEKEKAHGKSYQWWTMILKKPDGSIIALRASSEYIPMTSSRAPGEIIRYIFSPTPGKALEYIDRRSGKALLPELDFEKSFLPHPGPDARYVNGFATAGEILGHFARLEEDEDNPPSVGFSNVRVLSINTDFLIATARDFRDDGVEPKTPEEDWHFVPLSEADVRAQISAGFNYFRINERLRPWVIDEPVFVAGTPIYPDDLYRSNFTITDMFLDEPMVILGWSAGLPGPIASPEVIAQALRMRVASQITARERIFIPSGQSLGTLTLFRNKPPAWETEFWSAWYQLQAGAAGVIHEGRYRHRGYGWEPEFLLGPGLEGLTERDQFNFFYAFLRGAARSFDGSWGTSIYGQSEERLRVPAFIRAYEMGAKYFWFWTSDHGHHVPFAEQLRIARSITEYAAKHPRADRETLLRQAEVGIALPPGYAFNWNGTWGMEREALNRFGVGYGDISAAAFWEGVLCSRRGIEYDFLVDHPGIEKLGYKRIIRIGEDGSVAVTPPWPQKRVPGRLDIDAEPTEDFITPKQNLDARYVIGRAGKMEIDGDLSDWSNANWISLGKEHWRGDTYEFETRLAVTKAPVSTLGDKFQGMKFEDLSPEAREKYALEVHPHERMIVITEVDPGSPADLAGIRVGDAITYLGDRPTPFGLKIHQMVQEMGQRLLGKELQVRGRRSGRTNYGGDSDLSAEVAFLRDDENLYFAARVNDDIHSQHRYDSGLWKGDSVQIGLDPILERQVDDYGENGHEIGFALRDGRVIVWRWRGRRGQPVGEMRTVTARVVRAAGVTVYEAAIPFAVLAPLAPDTWPKCGIDVVINDSDKPDARKGRLELIPGAMTSGKHPAQFAVFECAQSDNPDRLSAALLWDKRCMPEGGAAEITISLSSPKAKEAIISAKLTSLGSPETKPRFREVKVPVRGVPSLYKFKVSSTSPAGRYRLQLSIRDILGKVAAADAQNIYIYPAASVSK